MFDPTIFDNLKVMLEGVIYDQDLSNEVIVINRKDIVDLATMSRSFTMGFQLPTKFSYPSTEISIQTSLKDLSSEILENDDVITLGCSIDVTFNTKLNTIKDCKQIKQSIEQIWNNRPLIKQVISYTYGKEENIYNQIQLGFNRKINENNIEDLPELVGYCIQSLHYLTEFGFSNN